MPHSMEGSEDSSQQSRNEEVSMMLAVGDLKGTPAMKKSLQEMVDLLRCPLCEDVFSEPTTLSSCGHSFCTACIDSYCCNAWVCPEPGCGMPMSITGANRSSYRTVNHQLSQTIASLKLIVKHMNGSADQWWTHSNAKQALLDHTAAIGTAGGDEEGDGDMVDLQKLVGCDDEKVRNTDALSDDERNAPLPADDDSETDWEG